MKSFALVIVLLLSSFQDFEKNNLIGKYYSIDNKFEKWSNIELMENGRFIYSYGLGSCQAKITGIYKVNTDKITFKNDTEFTKENKSDSHDLEPIYPDLSLSEWKIKLNSIKPLSEIDCGCFVEKSKHVKK